MKKFANVPMEPDMEILLYNESQIQGIDTRIEVWVNGEGLMAQSAIFTAKDVKHLSDIEIKLMIQNRFAKNDVVISHADPDYVFANFAFEQVGQAISA